MAAPKFARSRRGIETGMETEMMPEPEMTRRQIVLADGRYLIFYTFVWAAGNEKEEAEEDGRIEN